MMILWGSTCTQALTNRPSLFLHPANQHHCPEESLQHCNLHDPSAGRLAEQIWEHGEEQLVAHQDGLQNLWWASQELLDLSSEMILGRRWLPFVLSGGRINDWVLQGCSPHSNPPWVNMGEKSTGEGTHTSVWRKNIESQQLKPLELGFISLCFSSFSLCHWDPPGNIDPVYLKHSSLGYNCDYPSIWVWKVITLSFWSIPYSVIYIWIQSIDLGSNPVPVLY